MIVLILKRLFLISLILFISFLNTDSYSQLSYKYPAFSRTLILSENFESNIAYKLPFRGENYKFYGTLKYHISGKAYAKCSVHNTVIEAYHISETNCSQVNFKILKGSRHKYGKLIPGKPKRSGYYLYFLTPMKKNGKPLKYYYRSGVFRMFFRFDKEGQRVKNNKICFDFEALAQHILNIDNAAGNYGLRIKKIIFNRFLLDELFQTKAGKELQRREIYFAKFLSNKINRKFDDVYYIEFDKLK